MESLESYIKSRLDEAVSSGRSGGAYSSLFDDSEELVKVLVAAGAEYLKDSSDYNTTKYRVKKVFCYIAGKDREFVKVKLPLEDIPYNVGDCHMTYEFLYGKSGTLEEITALTVTYNCIARWRATDRKKVIGIVKDLEDWAKKY